MLGVDLLSWKDEMEFTMYVRREGRITIPKEIRDALNIREGELVNCTISKVKARK